LRVVPERWFVAVGRSTFLQPFRTSPYRSLSRTTIDRPLFFPCPFQSGVMSGLFVSASPSVGVTNQVPKDQTLSFRPPELRFFKFHELFSSRRLPSRQILCYCPVSVLSESFCPPLIPSDSVVSLRSCLALRWMFSPFASKDG